MHAQLLQSCSTLWDLWTVACQAPLSMGFFWQEYWSGLPFPSLVYLPNPGIKRTSLLSPTLAGGFFTTSTTWEVRKPIMVQYYIIDRSITYGTQVTSSDLQKIWLLKALLEWSRTHSYVRGLLYCFVTILVSFYVWLEISNDLL